MNKIKRSFRPKRIGFFTATSLVAGNMIGSGIFLLPAALASFGSIGLIGWLACAVGMFFIARVFSSLSLLFPGVSGGPYAYTRAGLGKFAGFIVGWCYCISIITSNAAITIALVGAMSTFFPALRLYDLLSASAGVGAIAVITYINLKGIRISGRLQLITTILKIIPLLLIGVGGLFFIRPRNFIPFNSSGLTAFGAISAAVALTIFPFSGIESATIASGSVSNPCKNIPKATMLGLLATTIAYLLTGIAIAGMFPPGRLQHSVTPFADAGVLIFGSAAPVLISGCVIVAAFGALNGWTMMQGQLSCAMAKKGVLPRVFAKTNNRGIAPLGIFLTSLFTSLLLILNYNKNLIDQFQYLLLLTAITTLIPYLFSAAAYLILHLRSKRVRARFSLFATGLIAFCFSLWAIVGSGEEIIYHGLLLVAAGIPIYWRMIYKGKMGMKWKKQQNKTAGNTI